MTQGSAQKFSREGPNSLYPFPAPLHFLPLPFRLTPARESGRAYAERRAAKTAMCLSACFINLVLYARDNSPHYILLYLFSVCIICVFLCACVACTKLSDLNKMMMMMTLFHHRPIPLSESVA